MVWRFELSEDETSTDKSPDLQTCMSFYYCLLIAVPPRISHCWAKEKECVPFWVIRLLLFSFLFTVLWNETYVVNLRTSLTCIRIQVKIPSVSHFCLALPCEYLQKSPIWFKCTVFYCALTKWLLDLFIWSLSILISWLQLLDIVNLILGGRSWPR